MPPSIYIGAEFSNYKALEVAIEQFQQENSVQLYVRSSRTLESARKRAPKRFFAENLNFAEVDYACIHGGRKLKSKPTTGQRPNQHSFLKECPFFIKVRTNSDGTALCVRNMAANHNHDTNKEAFAHLPQQRRLSVTDQEKVAKLIQMKASKKFLQEEIFGKTGKIVTMKDLHNIGKSKSAKDDMTALLNEMKKFNNATVEIVVDEERALKGIFFQKEDWKRMYKHFPENLFVDATHKLNNSRVPLFVLLVEDGNGESEIVCLWFVCSEDRDTLSQMLHIFKEHNDTSATKCVMTDKDLAARDVFSQNLPDVKMLICLYHVLRSMKREITTEKMGITSAQRSSVLSILQQLAYARCESDYAMKYNLLQETKLKSVINYYDNNWHGIQEEWVDGLRNHVTYFSNKTTSGLEAINQKIKSVVTKFRRIDVCFTELMSCISSLSIERDHRALRSYHKTPVKLEDPQLQCYQDTLTPHAFSFVKNQFNFISSVCPEKVDRVNEQCVFPSTSRQLINSTTSSCTCGIPVSVSLPCRHIFSLRQRLGLPLFSDELCSKKWTLEHYRQSQRVFMPRQSSAAAAIPEFEGQIGGIEVSSQHEKFKQASNVSQQLASLASEMSTGEYDYSLECLKTILEAWHRGQRVTVNVVDDVNVHGEAQDAVAELMVNEDEDVQEQKVVVSEELQEQALVVSEELQEQNLLVSEELQEQNLLVSEELQEQKLVVVGEEVQKQKLVVSEEMQEKELVVSENLQGQKLVVVDEEVQKQELVVSEELQEKELVVSEELQGQKLVVVGEEVQKQKLVVSEELQGQKLVAVDEEVQKQKLVVSEELQGQKLVVVDEEVQKQKLVVSEELQEQKLMVVGEEVQKQKLVVSEELQEQKLMVVGEEVQKQKLVVVVSEELQKQKLLVVSEEVQEQKQEQGVGQGAQDQEAVQILTQLAGETDKILYSSISNIKVPSKTKTKRGPKEVDLTVVGLVKRRKK